MTISPQQVAALRGVLAGDVGAIDRIEREAGLGDGIEFPALMTATFIAAARFRFGSGWSTADVIKFVGQVRIQGGDQVPVSPTLAEQLILSALRDTPLSVSADEATTAYTQFILLRRLVDDFGEEQLNLLMAQAQDDANRWIASQASA